MSGQELLTPFGIANWSLGKARKVIAASIMRFAKRASAGVSARLFSCPAFFVMLMGADLRVCIMSDFLYDSGWITVTGNGLANSNSHDRIFPKIRKE
jgi:hypothetical protein